MEQYNEKKRLESFQLLRLECSCGPYREDPFNLRAIWASMGSPGEILVSYGTNISWLREMRDP